MFSRYFREASLGASLLDPQPTIEENDTMCLRPIANALLACFFPRDPSDAQYEKASKAYKTYLTSSKPKDIKTALQNYEAALEDRRKTNHPDIAITEVNYAAALWTRYERSGQPFDALAQIIELDEDALLLWNDAVPKPAGYPTLLFNLATAHFHVYRVNLDAASISRAMKLYDDLRHDPTVPPNLQRKVLAMLGTALSTRCVLEDKSIRLDEAIDHLEEALSLLEPSNPSGTEEQEGDDEGDIAAIRADCWYNLGMAYDVRYNINKGSIPSDLDDAIKYNNLAQGLLPTDHPDQVPCLYNLARQLFTRYERARSESASLVPLDIHLDAKKGVRDLKDAERIVGEAQKLLADADASSQLKEGVDELRKVIDAHVKRLSQNTSKNTIPNTSRTSSPSRDSGIRIRDS